MRGLLVLGALISLPLFGCIHPSKGVNRDYYEVHKYSKCRPGYLKETGRYYSADGVLKVTIYECVEQSWLHLSGAAP